jgi:regulator of cell morphogenesis and NO signaling
MDIDGAIAAWADYSHGLQRHIRFEEELLFPLFEERTGLGPGAGPTAVMREEHAEIRQLLTRVGDEIGSPGAEAEALRRRLSYTLAEHNGKEEEILYPAIDDLLSPAESDDLVWKIQSFR